MKDEKTTTPAPIVNGTETPKTTTPTPVINGAETPKVITPAKDNLKLFFPVVGRVMLEEGADKTFNVAFILDNPFPDESYGELRLTFIKPGKKDKNGNSEDDLSGKRNKGLFEFYAKKKLVGCESFIVTGRMEYKDFSMRKFGKMVNGAYWRIDMDNPFPETHSGTFRVYLRYSDTQMVLEHLVSNALGIKPKTDGENV